MCSRAGSRESHCGRCVVLIQSKVWANLAGQQPPKQSPRVIHFGCRAVPQPTATTEWMYLKMVLSGVAVAGADGHSLDHGASRSQPRAAAALREVRGALGEEAAQTLLGWHTCAATKYAGMEFKALGRRCRETVCVRSGVRHLCVYLCVNAGGRNPSLGVSWQAGLSDDKPWSDIAWGMVFGSPTAQAIP